MIANTYITRGETGVGNWTIVVKDTQINSHNGTFTDWHLKLWGEAKDASKAKVLPMPTEEDDNNHAIIATTSLPATTTTLAPQPIATDTKPTTAVSDHPNRPVNSKPTPTDASSTPSPTSDEQSSETTTPANSTWLPSFLPTFGKSAATMVWVYASAALIGVFCISLAVYFYLARRKRLRNNPRGDYEFELLDEEEAEGLAGGGSSAEKRGAGGAGGGLAGGGGKRTRGGELYDAFAGGSDDEDVDDGGVYRDRVDEGGRGSGSGSGSGSASGANNTGRQTSALRSDSDDESGHHVVGDDDDDDESDSDDARPLRR